MTSSIQQLEPFFEWLIQVSWKASIVVVLILLVQIIFKKQLTPRWKYALWLLLVGRMVLPLFPQSNLSLFNFANSDIAKETWVHFEKTSPPKTTLPINAGVAVSNDHSGPADSRDSLTESPKGIVSYRTSTSQPQNSLNWKHMGIILWLTGALFLLLRHLWGTYRFSVKVSEHRLLTDPSVLELLEDCKQELGIKVPVTLIKTSLVESPALMGLIRPRILLPTHVLETFDGRELRFVFLHELAHIKRNDVAMNWVITLLQSLHWFNPFIWLGFHRMRIDREPACDALVLSQVQGEEHQNYGAMIIKLLENGVNHGLLSSVVGVLEDKKQIKTRIHLIAGFTKNSHRWSLVAAMLLLALSVTTMTNAVNKQPAIETAKAPENKPNDATLVAAKKSEEVPPLKTNKMEDSKAAVATDSSFNQQLINAVQTGYIEKAKALIEKGADINTLNENGSTSLMLAISLGDLEMVKMLLERGADVNVENKDGNSAIIVAARSKFPEQIIPMLLAKGADANARNLNRQTALIEILKTDQDPVVLEKIVKLLLQRGADANVVSSINETALIIAAEQREPAIKVISILLEKGAAVNLANQTGLTPLMVAASRNNTPLMKLLLEKGANVHSKAYGGDSAYHYLSNFWHSNPDSSIKESLSLLIDKGMDLNQVDHRGSTLLIDAFRIQQTKKQTTASELIKFLFEKGANPNISGSSEPLLISCVQNGLVNEVKLLVDHGADVTAKAKDGFSALSLSERILKGRMKNGKNVEAYEKIVEILKEAEAKRE
jgi:beta-lactamase regulating signal transducer with metallopeptidase domain/ankyrin repeat protein